MRSLWMAAGLALALGGTGAGPFAAGADSEGVRIQVGKGSVAQLLSAATPYRLEVGNSLLKETLLFTEPRELSFESGRIRFAVRCQGSPFPVDQVLRPVFTLQPGGSGYRLVVESLPVSIPGFGRVDLKNFVAPIEIQSLLRQTLLLQGRPAQLDVKVDRIAILTEGIDIRARLLLSPIAVR